MATAKPNILTEIWTDAEKVWSSIATTIEGDVARVEAVLPGAAPVVADIKQAASDALGAVATAEATYEPTLVSALEGLADAALTKVTGGLALPLVPLTNSGIQDIANLGQKWFQAWALKTQASLAENNAAQGGGTASAASTGAASGS